MIVSVLLSILVFTRYRYSYITHLTEEDIEWVVNKNGDSILFVSNYGDSDYLISGTMRIYEKENKFFYRESNVEYKDTLESYGWYYFRVYPFNRSDTIRDIDGLSYQDKCISQQGILWGRFLVKKFVKDKLEFSSIFGMKMSKGYDQVKQCDSITEDLKPFIIHDSNLHNYIIFDDENSDYSEKMSKRIKNKIDTYVINKKYGLIYYKFEDGEEFFRIFD